MRKHTFLATITGALALTIVTTTGLTPSASAAAGPERRTVEQTHALLAAFERQDLNAISARIDEDATFTIPLSLSGAPEPAGHFTGKDQILGYVDNVLRNFRRIRFTDMRISVTAHGKTSFVQANGDFTTADDRSYRNVYVYRFDWRNGRMVHAEEYANPVTLCKTFADLDC
ncbi:nuclear transport factor 2 family protein [Nonomuraea sp. MTCD27]|uniref:nuclear transport factor 2 family protein n=1 Tax=Nonomuraea sp. MTCD27 TaxID=1676747 RepID=UPI0035BFC000